MRLVSCGIILGAVLLSGFSWAADNSGSPPLTFRLEGKEKGFDRYVDLNLGGKTVDFRKEPTYEGRKIVRGSLDQSNTLAFAWDRSAGKLYVDLNGDLDLTNDPGGTFSSKTGRGSYQWFEGIRISKGEGASRIDYTLDFTAYGGRNGYLRIKSGWEGNVVLHGKEYHVSASGGLDGTLGKGRGEIVIAPLDPALAKGGKYVQRFASMPEDGRVFLDGREYVLGFEFKDGDLEMTATDSTPALGQLRLEGKSISYLMLDGPARVLVEHPGPSISVPVGAYTLTRLILDSGNSDDLYWGTSTRPVIVRENASTPLYLGAPLRSEIKPERSFGLLTLAYKLKGIGGESYSNLNNRRGPPKLAVSNGGGDVCTGAFQYG